MTPTDSVAVGMSKGLSVAKDVLLPGVPVPFPRIPVGLGSLSLEAEAHDLRGSQKAAMIWARGANVPTESGRIAVEADAYTLAAAFGGDFSEMLVTGTSRSAKRFPLFRPLKGLASCSAAPPSISVRSLRSISRPYWLDGVGQRRHGQTRER
ncbi:hypothetical protein [Bradyrhizobium genosp. P]|uniref:hypothetical protein n=1 Tax=Bradyrhizobium genosp. P TaxID=83641 RepID=UPI003CF7EE78